MMLWAAGESYFWLSQTMESLLFTLSLFLSQTASTNEFFVCKRNKR